MEEAGVVVARTLDMFEDYTKAFTMLYDRIPRGNRVAVLSNAGFECSSVLDKLYGLVPAQPLGGDEGEARGLPSRRRPRRQPGRRDADGDDAAVRRGRRGDGRGRERRRAPRLAGPGHAGARQPLAGSRREPRREHPLARVAAARLLLELFRGTTKPIVVAVDSGRLYDDFVFVLQRGGIPVWRKIDRASRALSALATL